MAETTSPAKAAAAKALDAQCPRPVEVVFFALGVIILVVSSVLVHFHPRPYPIDLQTTETIQALHLYPWVTSFIEFFSSLNNPTPSIIALAAWFVGLSIIGFIARARGRSGLPWFQ